MTIPSWVMMDESDRLVFAAMTALTFLDKLQPGQDAFVGDPEQGGLNVNQLLRASLLPYMPEAAFHEVDYEREETEETTKDR